MNRWIVLFAACTISVAPAAAEKLQLQPGVQIGVNPVEPVSRSRTVDDLPRGLQWGVDLPSPRLDRLPVDFAKPAIVATPKQSGTESQSIRLNGNRVAIQDAGTFTPREDTEVVLHNPDMGWVLYENYAIDPRPNGTGTMNVLPRATFEGCDFVAVMFAWSDIEKEQDRFDWSRVDAACDYWQERGKAIHLRISAEPLFGWSRVVPPGGLGIPDWLLARIPDAQKRRRDDGPMFGWHVDARNSIYRQRLRVFLQEANAHFSGKREPALVDLRGFGRWGEWHSGFPYASIDEKREALQHVLDIWTGCFHNRMLTLSYSHDPDGPADLYAGSMVKFDREFTKNYDAYLRFSAFDLAMKKPNVTLRRDGAGGAVCSNQRKLCEHFYRDLRRAPQASEFVAGYAHMRGGGDAWVKWVVDDALSLHPNYVGLLGYSGQDALDFMLERPDLVALGMKRMGYRLVPLRLTVPKTVRAGKPFAIEMEWINRGTGRALRDYLLRLRLADKRGQTLAQSDAGTLPTSQWLEGDKHTLNVDAAFPNIGGDSGAAKLFIALHDPATGRNIKLPLSKRTRDEFCEIGETEVIR